MLTHIQSIDLIFISRDVYLFPYCTGGGCGSSLINLLIYLLLIRYYSYSGRDYHIKTVMTVRLLRTVPREYWEVGMLWYRYLQPCILSWAFHGPWDGSPWERNINSVILMFVPLILSTVCQISSPLNIVQYHRYLVKWASVETSGPVWRDLFLFVVHHAIINSPPQPHLSRNFS